MRKYTFAEISGAIEWLDWLDWWTVLAGWHRLQRHRLTFFASSWRRLACVAERRCSSGRKRLASCRMSDLRLGSGLR